MIRIVTIKHINVPDGFIVGMVGLHGRGRDIKAPPPDLNLHQKIMKSESYTLISISKRIIIL